jgi:hypothetical protein
VAERRQQSFHADGADLMAHPAQRGGELVVALRHPQQRTHRIAERRRFDNAPQIADQRRVLAHQSWTAPARPTMRLLWNGVASNCFKPRTSVERAYPVTLATASRPPLGWANLRRREQASPPLAELRAHIVPAAANRSRVDHAHRHTAPRNPAAPSQIAPQPATQNRFSGFPKVLNPKPAAFLLLGVPRKGEAAAINPPLADLANRPTAEGDGQGRCDLREAERAGDVGETVPILVNPTPAMRA